MSVALLSVYKNMKITLINSHKIIKEISLSKHKFRFNFALSAVTHLEGDGTQ